MKKLFSIVVLSATLTGCNDFFLSGQTTHPGSIVTVVGLLALDTDVVAGGLQTDITVESPLQIVNCTNPVAAVDLTISNYNIITPNYARVVTISDDILNGWEGGVHVFSCNISIPAGIPYKNYFLKGKAILVDNTGKQIFVKSKNGGGINVVP